MGIKVKNVDCDVFCDICEKRIPITQEVKKLQLENGKVQFNIADVTIRFSPVYRDDSYCEVVAVNCTENKILCVDCAAIYRDRKESLRNAYNERTRADNLLQFVKEQN